MVIYLVCISLVIFSREFWLTLNLETKNISAFLPWSQNLDTDQTPIDSSSFDQPHMEGISRKYSRTVSKTLPIDKDGALELLRHQADETLEFAGIPRDGQPRVSNTEKWRYWRINLADESKVSINIQDKPGGKSVVAINHDGLATNENLFAKVSYSH